MKLIDVFGRPLNSGDIVLCPYYQKKSLSEAKVMEVDSIINEIKQFAISLGCNINDYDNMYCYKVNPVDNTYFSKLSLTFDLQSYINQNKTEVDLMNTTDYNYNLIHYKNTMDLLGRNLQIGDMVIYAISSSKPRYGIVVGNHKVFTDKLAYEPLHFVFKLETLLPEEVVIKRDLYKAYNDKQNKELSIATLNANHDNSKFKPGDVYKSENKGYLCLGTGYLEIYYNNFPQVYTSPMTHNIAIEFKMNTKSQRFIDKVVSKTVSKKDIKDMMCLQMYNYTLCPWWNKVELENYYIHSGFSAADATYYANQNYSPDVLSVFRRLSSRFIEKDNFMKLNYMDNINLENDFQIEVNLPSEKLKCVFHFNI